MAPFDGVGEGAREASLRSSARLGIQLEAPSWAAEYIWQAILWSVIEATEKLDVVLPGVLGRHVARVADDLRRQRNAVRHPEEEQFWDKRLTAFWDRGQNTLISIHVAHTGLGGLIISELQVRDGLGLVDPADVRPVDP